MYIRGPPSRNAGTRDLRWESNRQRLHVKNIDPLGFLVGGLLLLRLEERRRSLTATGEDPAGDRRPWSRNSLCCRRGATTSSSAIVRSPSVSPPSPSRGVWWLSAPSSRRSGPACSSGWCLVRWLLWGRSVPSALVIVTYILGEMRGSPCGH